MKGYIENISNLPKYIFKTHVLPGGRLDLEDIYSLFVSMESENIDFKDWLDQFVSDKSVWKVVFKEEKKIEKKVEPVMKKTVEVKSKPSAPAISGIGIKKEWSEEDIVKLTVAEAKKQLPKIKDKRLLKRALRAASSRPRKEQLCKLLYNRIDELP